MKPSHCHLHIGTLPSDASALIDCIEQHNFICKLTALFPKQFTQSSEYKNGINKELCSGYLVQASLNNILQFLLAVENLETDDGPSIPYLKLVLLDRDITHEDTLCLAKGQLHLRLTQPTYQSSGFEGKKSQVSQGNNVVHQQFHDITIDLTKGLDKQLKQRDKNTSRLFWYAENMKNVKDRYFISCGNCDSSNLKRVLEQFVDSCTLKQSQVRSIDLGLCNIPDLDAAFVDPIGKSSIVKENRMSSLADTLEWITYASIGGQQLFPFDSTDDYISSYKSLLEKKSEAKLFKVDFSGALIDTELTITTLQNLLSSNELPWFALLMYGVRDCNTSYGESTAHGFSEDGCNDTVLLVSPRLSKYIAWEIVDSSDSHH